MDFGLTADQEQMQQSIARSLAEICTLPRVRAAIEPIRATRQRSSVASSGISASPAC